MKTTLVKLLAFFYDHWELVFVLMSATILLTAVVKQYVRYDLPSNGLFIGWDTPDYVRLGNEFLVFGPTYAISQWRYPQLYVWVLASVGKLIGLDNSERMIPLLLGGLLGITNYVIALRISSDRRIAALSAIMTPLVMGSLKLVADSHRNLLAYLTLLGILASGLQIPQTLKTLKSPKFLYQMVGFGFVAFTQFETFALFGVVLLFAGASVRKIRIFLGASVLIVIPTLILFLLFPAYFLEYFGTPILSFRNSVGLKDLVYWTGGTFLSFALLLLGVSYLVFLMIRKPKLLPAIFLSWFLITMVIFWAIVLRLTPLSSDYAVRSAILLPSALLIALGILPLMYLARRGARLLEPHLMSKARIERMITGGTVILIVASVIFSSAIVTAYNYGAFFQPFVTSSVTQELDLVRSVLGSNTFPEPVFVFQGNSIWHIGLYRSYVGGIVGPHFAYYGSLENLLELKQTNSGSSDPQTKTMENFWGSAYFNELTSGVSRTSYLYFHRDMIQNSSQLLVHPLVVITPDFYDNLVPYGFLPYRIAEGIYVVKGGSLIKPEMTPVAGPVVNLIRDGVSTNVTSQYQYLYSDSSQVAVVTVNPPPGSTTYNLTGLPTGWRFLTVYQSGFPSSPELSPKRPSGNSARVGNDPADSLLNWSGIGENVSLVISQDRLEGPGSLFVSGRPDSLGNVGATYSQTNSTDIGGEDTMSFWAVCSTMATLGLLLIGGNGSSRTYYDARANGIECSSSWSRILVDLSSWSSETSNFDLHQVESFRVFAVPRSPSALFQLGLDDLVLDRLPSTSTSVFKGRLLPQSPISFHFIATISGASPLAAQPPSPGWTLTIVLFATVFIVVTLVCLIHTKVRRSMLPKDKQDVAHVKK